MTDLSREVAEKIIAEYKAHYDFPWQGESHMRDCIEDVLETVLPLARAEADELKDLLENAKWYVEQEAKRIGDKPTTDLLEAIEKHLAQPEQTIPPHESTEFHSQEPMPKPTLNAAPAQDAPSAGDGEFTEQRKVMDSVDEFFSGVQSGKIPFLTEEQLHAETRQMATADIEQYIRDLKWSDQATEHEKTLVAGNLRTLHQLMTARLTSLAGEVETLRGYKAMAETYERIVGYKEDETKILQNVVQVAQESAERAESEAASLRARLAGAEKK